MIEILYFIPILLSAYVIGYKIFSLFKLKTTILEQSIFSIVFGLAFYSYITLLLGILGFLYASLYWVIITIILILGYRLWMTFLQRILKTVKKFKFKYDLETFLIIVISVFVVLSILSTLVPPFLWDEMDYRLAHPKIWARNHELTPIFSRWISEFPSNVDMLYVIGLLLKNGILSKFFALSFNLILGAAIFSFGTRFYNRKTALLATSIYLTLPMIMNHIGSAYVDIPSASMIFLALYSLIAWLKDKNSKWFYLSAILTGLSLATKFTSALPAVILGLFVIFFTIKGEKTYALKKIIFFGLIIVILLTPWLLKTYFRTGNPVWPIAFNVFGGSYWSSEIASYFSQPLEISVVNSVWDFVLIPWNITMHSSNFSLLLGWNAIFLSFIPLLIFYRKIDKTTIYLLIYSLIFLYSGIFASIFFFGVMRYLMIYPTLALISAIVIFELLSDKFLRKILFILLFVSFAFTGVLWFGVFEQKMLYVAGIDDESQYYSKLVDHNGYPVFDYMNQNISDNSKTFLFRDTRGYLSDKDYIAALPFEQIIFDYDADEDDFYEQLKKNKVTHVLINTNVEVYKPQPVVKNRIRPISQAHQDMMDKLLSKHGTLLIEDKGVSLYELR